MSSLIYDDVDLLYSVILLRLKMLKVEMVDV